STSPYFPPEECQATWRCVSIVHDDNKLTGAFGFEAVGTPEGRLRRALAGVPPAERANYFDQTVQRLSPNAVVQSVACDEPDDFARPLHIRCDVAARRFVLGDGQQRMLALPMLQTIFGDRTLSDLFGQTGPAERKYGLKLWASRRALFEETIKLPAGWT